MVSMSLNAVAVVSGGFAIITAVPGGLMRGVSASPLVANSDMLITTRKTQIQQHILKSEVILLRRGL